MIPFILQTSNLRDIQQYIPFTRKDNNPDIIEINKEGEGITIEIVRDLQKILIEKPYFEEYRVVIIYGVETANPVCQNALLKSLEEPPTFIQFILQTPTPSILLPTLRSRCKIITPSNSQPTTYNPQPTTISQVIDWSEKIKTRQQALTTITEIANELRNQLHVGPSLTLVKKLKHTQQAHLMIQANTNIRLCMEWLGFKLLPTK